jgi:long-chain acyl-CoA synthetase
LKGDVPLGPEAQRFEELLAQTTAAPPSVTIDPREDVAALQYTGGTTGVSKAAMLTHFNLLANVQQARAWNPVGGPPGSERILTVIPLFHAYGMTICMNYGLYCGYELILLPRFDLKEVMETIKATQPTVFPGVPTMYVAVNNFPNADDYGVSSIKYCNSGAAPLPLEVIQGFEQRFGGRIREGYGLSETSPFSHGQPFMVPARTMDGDGYFSIVDRKKDMIIASGYNVYPRDVEEVLYEHPAVLECCVAGVPDQYRGETVKAYIVLRPGLEVTDEELDAFCRERLAAFKVPRIYEYRESLPKSAVGKVLRRQLLNPGLT